LFLRRFSYTCDKNYEMWRQNEDVIKNVYKSKKNYLKDI
jgi:hypothetical protein